MWTLATSERHVTRGSRNVLKTSDAAARGSDKTQRANSIVAGFPIAMRALCARVRRASDFAIG